MRNARARTCRESPDDSTLALLESVAMQYGYSVKDLAADSRTLRKHLKVEESLILLVLRGTEAFGNQRQWNLWPRSSCDALKGKKPVEILISKRGLEKLHGVLDRVTHGAQPQTKGTR